MTGNLMKVKSRRAENEEGGSSGQYCTRLGDKGEH